MNTVFPKTFSDFSNTAAEPIDLKRNKMKMAKLVLIAAGFLFLGVTLLRSSDDTGTVFMGWVCVFFFTPALLTALSMIISSAPAVRITPSALILYWVFGKKIEMQWQEIADFKMSQVGSQAVISIALKDPGKSLRNAQGWKAFFKKLNPKRDNNRAISSNFVEADFNELYPFLQTALTK